MNKNKGRGATGVCQSLRYQFGRDDQNQVFSKPTLEVRTLCGLSHSGHRKEEEGQEGQGQEEQSAESRKEEQGAGRRAGAQGRETREEEGIVTE